MSSFQFSSYCLFFLPFCVSSMEESYKKVGISGMNRVITYLHKISSFNGFSRTKTPAGPTHTLVFNWSYCPYKQFEPPHDKTNKMTVHPAKTQISLSIHPVCSESSLSAQWVSKDPSFLHVDSEDSDQTGRMPRLIRVFAERTCHFAGFVMRWLV